MKRGAFNTNPKPSATVRNGSRERSRSQKKPRQEKSKIKSMLICFYDSKSIIHKEFVSTGQTVNAVFYVGVLKRLVSRIRQIRPEYREEGSWRLLHDNAPSHRSTLTRDYLTKNRIVTINHSTKSSWLKMS